MYVPNLTVGRCQCPTCCSISVTAQLLIRSLDLRLTFFANHLQVGAINTLFSLATVQPPVLPLHTHSVVSPDYVNPSACFKASGSPRLRVLAHRTCALSNPPETRSGRGRNLRPCACSDYVQHGNCIRNSLYIWAVVSCAAAASGPVMLAYGCVKPAMQHCTAAITGSLIVQSLAKKLL